ncbi:MAG: ABC transporter substrate-binding protein, partial [Hyphomicrobiaceae bacterium]
MIGRRCFQAVAALWAITVAILSQVATTNAADEAVAASGPPLNIALFVNSSPILCYSSGHIQATRTLAHLAAERINTLGGVRGRPIELTIYDNKNDLERAKRNVAKALEMSDLLAMIGLSNEDRAAKVFQAMESISGANKVPFISNVSVGQTFKKYKNVFSTRPNQELERVPVMAEFFKANNIKTVTFLGRSGVLYIDTIGKGLKNILQDQMTADIRVDLGSDRKLDIAQLDAAIDRMEADPPGMLALAVGTAHTKQVLRRLQRANLELPVFMVGYLSRDLFDPQNPYGQPVYGIDWASVPEVESDRLFNVLGQGAPENWVFADRRTATVDNWKKNQCDAFWGNYVPSTYSTRNIAAAKEGARFADMVKLVASSAAKSGDTLDTGSTYSGKTTPIEKYRNAIMADLGRTYAAGSGAFKGIFENWSFHPERVRSLTPFVVILPHTIGRKQLAPTQFVRLRNGKFKTIETLYMDIDLIRAYSVDNNAKSFFAEFYLAMRVSPNFSIEDITFTNAFLDPRASRDALTNGREISIDILHPGGKSDAYPADMRMYKVAGRFRFKPDFSQYPFDTQQFSIDLQPKSGDKTFIIQAPPAKMRDTVVASEGWIPDKQYVSFVEDFVPMVDAFTHTPSVVPFYNVRYVWQ